jgi:phage-related protein
VQRAITDFGADVPFGRIQEKLREHHGIEVPISSAQVITQNHAACVHQTQLLHTEIPTKAGVEQLIVEMDGTLIPIVEAPDAVDEDGNPIDRRTTRSSRFKEARLALARSGEEFQPKFGATFGTPDDAAD